MAISERATRLLESINIILDKPAMPILVGTLIPSKQHKRISISEPPKPQFKHSAPTTPFTPSYSSKVNSAPSEPVSIIRETNITTSFEQNPRNEAYQLLQEIKLKIETDGDVYLKPNNEILKQDIADINALLSLKFKKFRDLAADFIILVEELSSILNGKEAVIVKPDDLPKEHVNERDTSCFNPLSKCRSYYCQ